MKHISSKLLLRIAAVIMFLHATGHTLGVITWQNRDNTIPVDVIRKMEDTHFSFQGKDATLAAFFSGHGYAGTILLLLIASLLWMLAGSADKNTTKTLWVLGMAIVLLAIIEMIYFFPLAVAFSILSAGLVFLSINRISKET